MQLICWIFGLTICIAYSARTGRRFHRATGHSVPHRNQAESAAGFWHHSAPEYDGPYQQYGSYHDPAQWSQSEGRIPEPRTSRVDTVHIYVPYGTCWNHFIRNPLCTCMDRSLSDTILPYISLSTSPISNSDYTIAQPSNTMHYIDYSWPAIYPSTYPISMSTSWPNSIPYISTYPTSISHDIISQSIDTTMCIDYSWPVIIPPSSTMYYSEHAIAQPMHFDYTWPHSVPYISSYPIFNSQYPIDIRTSPANANLPYDDGSELTQAVSESIAVTESLPVTDEDDSGRIQLESDTTVISKEDDESEVEDVALTEPFADIDDESGSGTYLVSLSTVSQQCKGDQVTHRLRSSTESEIVNIERMALESTLTCNDSATSNTCDITTEDVSSPISSLSQIQNPDSNWVVVRVSKSICPETRNPIAHDVVDDTGTSHTGSQTSTTNSHDINTMNRYAALELEPVGGDTGPDPSFRGHAKSDLLDQHGHHPKPLSTKSRSKKKSKKKTSKNKAAPADLPSIASPQILKPGSLEMKQARLIIAKMISTMHTFLDICDTDLGGLHHLVLDLYVQRISSVPEDASLIDNRSALYQNLGDMKAGLYLFNNVSPVTDLAGVARINRDIARAKVTDFKKSADHLQMLIAGDPYSVAAALNMVAAQTRAVEHLIENWLYKRPQYYRLMRPGCWPVGDFADALEMIVAEFAQFASSFHRKLEIILGDDIPDSIRDATRFACDTLRLRLLCQVLNPVHNLPSELRELLAAEFRQRMSGVLAQPERAHEIYYRIVATAESARASIATDKDLDEDDRITLLTLEALSKDLDLTIPPVSLPASLENDLSVDMFMAELPKCFRQDLLQVTKAVRNKIIQTTSQMTSLITKYLFRKCDTYDGDRLAGIVIVIYESLCWHLNQPMRNMNMVGVVARIANERRDQLVDLALANNPNVTCNREQVIKDLKESFNESSRFVLEYMAQEGSLPVPENVDVLYQALPLGIIRKVLYIKQMEQNM